MISIIRKHPLLSCLFLALLLRLAAVAFSRGYMASDDYFETVKIAYQAVSSGLTDGQGLMRWDVVPSQEIGRSPLYVVSLYGLMKLQQTLGIVDLDRMMYLIRLVHAMLSLLTVWLGYKYIYEATHRVKWAVVGGLILGMHFLAPYLAVRNLIEQVSADLLIPALFLAYIGTRDRNSRYLILAGLLSGLSWMMRFNVALALWPIPLAIWFLTREFRPVLYFCLGLSIIIIFSGSLDLIYLGSFGRSSLNILRSVFYPAGPPPLPQPFWFFAVLALVAFIPPFSFFFLFSFFRKKIAGEHLILMSSTLMFFIGHSLITQKEERFLIPIFPQLIILGVIGLDAFFSAKKRSLRIMKLFKISAIMAIVVDFALLPIFTFNYGHKGLVEPFVFLSRQSDVRNILVDSTERMRHLPYEYSGFGRPRPIILYPGDSPGIADSPQALDSVNYVVIFTDDSLPEHILSLEPYLGKLEPIYQSSPSLIDRALHIMNPRHNFIDRAWVCFRRSR